MSEKPTTQPKTPTLATNEDIANYDSFRSEFRDDPLCGCGSERDEPHEAPCFVLFWPSIKARIENDAKTIEALAGTGFTSGCADGHPEIRYQGETCPLCEARMEIAELKQNRSYANDQFNDLRDEIKRLEDLILKLDWEPSENQLEYHLSLEADAITRRRAALSRPSSAPGDGEVGK